MSDTPNTRSVETVRTGFKITHKDGGQQTLALYFALQAGDDGRQSIVDIAIGDEQAEAWVNEGERPGNVEQAAAAPV